MLLLDRFEAIDLTHSLDSSVPTWSGGCGFHQEIKLDYEHGLRVMSYKCHAGVGTHMDAPSHFFRGGANIADIPISQLIVPVCILNVAQRAHPDFFVLPEDILEYEGKWGKIPPSALVLAHTGWDKYWKNADQYRNSDETGKMHFPGFDIKAAELLLERKIAGIGIDTLSPDGSNNQPENKFPVHEAILGAGKYIIENAAHLSKMPEAGAFALAMPIKVSEGTEAAMRLVGLIVQ